MAGGDIYNLASTVDVLRSIECPICTDVPVPPIFNCENGHFICKQCRTSVQVCGLCQGKFTTMRNYPLEAIVRSSTFKCKNEAAGCRQRILGDAYEGHLLKCEFGPVECNHTSTKKCTKEMIPCGQFVSHLREVHKFPQYVHNFGPTSLAGVVMKEKSEHIGTAAKTILWPLDIISFQESSFFFARKILDQGIFRVWLTYFGSEEIALSFEATVVVTKPNTEHPKITWTIPVHSFRKPMDEIKSSSSHFAIPIANLVQFCDVVGQVHHLQIRYIIVRKEFN